jgi:hypothetical protein
VTGARRKISSPSAAAMAFTIAPNPPWPDHNPSVRQTTVGVRAGGAFFAAGRVEEGGANQDEYRQPRLPAADYFSAFAPACAH